MTTTKEKALLCHVRRPSALSHWSGATTATAQARYCPNQYFERCLPEEQAIAEDRGEAHILAEVEAED